MRDFRIYYLVFGLQMEITHRIGENRTYKSTEMRDFAH